MSLFPSINYKQMGTAIVGDTTNVTGIISIQIRDSSGNLANGNNIVVSYYESTGGIIGPTLKATIPGQSYLIYAGIVQTITNGGLTKGPLKSYTLTGDFDGGTPSPPLTPDLKIVSIDVTQKADSGGNNGKVTIIATSTHLPIDYYIDNVLQEGNVDLTVTSGNHVAKVIDANDIVVTQPFNVQRLNQLLFKDPSLTIGLLISRWNAAFNPIVFEYHREDLEVTSVVLSTIGNGKAVVNVNGDVSALVAGDLIYVKTNNGLYDGVYPILSVGTGVVNIDLLFNGLGDEGFLNSDDLRPYYKILTKITYVDPYTGQFNTIYSTNRPNGKGIAKADISSFLQSILQPQPDLSDYTQINYRDMGLAASYTVEYAEVWEGNTPTYVTLPNPYYVVYSAMQLQQFGGGSLFNFVTQPGGTQLAKWLTDAVEPTYSPGNPFDLPFIYSEQMAGQSLYYVFQGLDINRQPLGDDEYTSFLLNEDASYLLNQDGTKLIIARQSLSNTPIVEHVGLNRLLVNQDFGPTCYYIKAQLFYLALQDDGGSAETPLTEQIIVRVDRKCPINPVYVRWIGLNGSWNYFMFTYRQTLTLDIQNPVIIKDYVQDWENAEGIERVVSKDAGPKVQLYADQLDNNDVDGLKSIKFSPIVQVLTANNPPKWQTIVVNSSTYTERDTQNGLNDFSITYSLPSVNIQNQ